ncbi:MAG: phosphatidylglycerophosphatase A [Acholeplasmataceae bacterium]|jgi:phosphatidylglycerophosphatase A
MNKKTKIVFTREEMLEMNIKTLKKRGVTVEDIATITFNQQGKYTKNIEFSTCIESVEKLLSFRDVFHYVQLAVALDVLAEEKKLPYPLQDIIYHDLGLFGVDEVMGLDVAGTYGTIGQTNFGDIDVNKPGIVKILNDQCKEDGTCHTFLDDIVGAIAAAASTRVAQVMNETEAHKKDYELISLFEEEE